MWVKKSKLKIKEEEYSRRIISCVFFLLSIILVPVGVVNRTVVVLCPKCGKTKLFDHEIKCECGGNFEDIDHFNWVEPQKPRLFNYSEARKLLIRNLRKACKAHRSGKFEHIGDGYADYVSRFSAYPDPRLQNLVTALNFWDSWISAQNHGWIDPTVKKEDYPQNAEKIIRSIEKC